MPPAAPLLACKDVAAERGLRPLFSAASLALEAGAVTFLRGPNGTGKTTLLRILAGLTAAAAGTIERRASLLYWGHASALKDELTAQENLELLCTDAEVPTAQMQSALARVGLQGRTHVPARKLSAGQRRRIGLAWLSLAQARVWLLDEPTTALDANGVDLFARLLSEHLARGGAACIATHQDIPGLRAIAHTLHMQAHAS